MSQEFEQIVKELEIEREKILKEAYWAFGFIITLFLSLFILTVLKGDDSFFIIASLILFATLSFIAYSHYQSKWKTIYKENLIGKIVKTLLPEVDFFPNQYISKELYHKSRLFERQPSPDRYTGENLLNGKIGKTRIMASWIHSEYMTEHSDSDDKDHTEWHTIFKGLFIVAGFNKRFSSTTLVLPDSFIKISPKGLERAKLEDPEFENIFDVFTDDQVEARYILTPAFMEKIKKFREKMDSQIRLSFIDSTLYVAISSDRKILQTPSFLNSLEDYPIDNMVEIYKEEILFMVSIVDELDLNLRLWIEPAQT